MVCLHYRRKAFCLNILQCYKKVYSIFFHSLCMYRWAWIKKIADSTAERISCKLCAVEDLLAIGLLFNSHCWKEVFSLATHHVFNVVCRCPEHSDRFTGEQARFNASSEGFAEAATDRCRADRSGTASFVSRSWAAEAATLQVASDASARAEPPLWGMTARSFKRWYLKVYSCLEQWKLRK